MKIKIIMLLALTTLVACGPRYRTDYQYVPPASGAGRMCAQQCLDMKDQCHQNCSVQENTCETQTQIESQADYLLYVAQHSKDEEALHKTPRDFASNRSCNYSRCHRICEDNYRLCFTNCGGRVIANTYCTSNCEDQ